MFPNELNGGDLTSVPISVSECCQIGDWIDPKSGSAAGEDLARPGCQLDQSRSPLSVQIVPLGIEQARPNSLVRLLHADQTRFTVSGTGSGGVSSWVFPPTPTCYDSGDSVDSFSTTTSTSSSLTSFSLPPTPPATPPNNWSQNSPASSPAPSPKSGGRFKCDSCPKLFGDRAHLAEHRRYRHSDDRPHGCPECLKGFKSRSNLNQHIRTTHQKKKFDCSVRPEFFLVLWLSGSSSSGRQRSLGFETWTQRLMTFKYLATVLLRPSVTGQEPSYLFHEQSRLTKSFIIKHGF